MYYVLRLYFRPDVVTIVGAPTGINPIHRSSDKMSLFLRLETFISWCPGFKSHVALYDERRTMRSSKRCSVFNWDRIWSKRPLTSQTATIKLGCKVIICFKNTKLSMWTVQRFKLVFWAYSIPFLNALNSFCEICEFLIWCKNNWNRLFLKHLNSTRLYRIQISSYNIW